MADAVKDPPLSVKRSPGRPRVPEVSTKLSTWVPVREYDRLLRLANARDQSLSGLVRSLLILRLK